MKLCVHQLSINVVSVFILTLCVLQNKILEEQNKSMNLISHDINSVGTGALNWSWN